MPKLKYKLENPDNTVVQNFVMRDGWIKKIPGTNKYNLTGMPVKVDGLWRYYGIKESKEFVKKSFAYAGGKVYMGDDSAKTFTEVKGGRQIVCYPETAVMQVAGTSRMYVFDGYNIPIYYEGNDAGIFQDSVMPYKLVQGVEKDGRLWGFERNSSILYGSRALLPDDFDSNYAVEIVVGKEKDSFIRRIELLGDDLYIFKNNSIYVLRGDTRATYEVDLVMPDFGLLAQRACCFVGSAIVMVSQQDKEIYEFIGTPTPRMISKDIQGETFAEKLDMGRTDEIVCCWDTVNRLFRLSYNEINAVEAYQNNEVVFPTDEAWENGQPKWSETYGARISCYSVWNRQGDHTLVTGRSDIGYAMYHNRGSNFDNDAMECIIETDDIVVKDSFNTQFNSWFIRGKPSSGTLNVQTLLDGRVTGEGANTSQSVSDLGEEGSLEGVAYKVSDVFKNWFPLLHGYDIGESIRFRILDETLDKEIELEDLVIDYTERDDSYNSLVGG